MKTGIFLILLTMAGFMGQAQNKSCNENVSIPATFTPNGDGVHDCFEIVFKQAPGTYELKIFNRWGENIFVTDKPNACWDGNREGKPVEAGVYMWILNFQLGKEEFTCTGSVTLLR